jgi:hypothetical protein
MPTTRLTIELDSDLLEQLERAAGRTDGGVMTPEEIISARLALTIGYDLTGAPLFLDHDQHKRLRSLSGQSAVRGAEALLDAIENMTKLTVEGVPITLKTAWLERLASRAKVEGKPTGQLAREYATDGIRERIGY